MNFNEHAHVQTLDMTSLVAGSVGLSDGPRKEVKANIKSGTEKGIYKVYLFK